MTHTLHVLAFWGLCWLATAVVAAGLWYGARRFVRRLESRRTLRFVPFSDTVRGHYHGVPCGRIWGKSRPPDEVLEIERLGDYYARAAGHCVDTETTGEPTGSPQTPAGRFHVHLPPRSWRRSADGLRFVPEHGDDDHRTRLDAATNDSPRRPTWLEERLADRVGDDVDPLPPTDRESDLGVRLLDELFDERDARLRADADSPVQRRLHGWGKS